MMVRSGSVCKEDRVFSVGGGPPSDGVLKFEGMSRVEMEHGVFSSSSLSSKDDSEGGLLNLKL